MAPDMREQAKRLFIESKGKMPIKDIAEKLGLNAVTVSSWKNRYGWGKTKKGEPGKMFGKLENSNAAGHGAPVGSKNALTHGLYSKLKYSDFTADELLLMHSVPDDRVEHLKSMLAECEVREKRMYARLEELYKNYKAQFEEGMMADSTLIMSRKKPGQTVEQTKKSVFASILQTEEALTRLQDKKRNIIDSLHRAERDEKQYQLNVMKLELEKMKFKSGVEGVGAGVTIVINGEKELED